MNIVSGKNVLQRRTLGEMAWGSEWGSQEIMQLEISAAGRLLMVDYRRHFLVNTRGQFISRQVLFQSDRFDRKIMSCGIKMYLF